MVTQRTGAAGAARGWVGPAPTTPASRAGARGARVQTLALMLDRRQAAGAAPPANARGRPAHPRAAPAAASTRRAVAVRSLPRSATTAPRREVGFEVSPWCLR